MMMMMAQQQQQRGGLPRVLALALVLGLLGLASAFVGPIRPRSSARVAALAGA